MSLALIAPKTLPYIVGVVAEIRIMFDNKANEAFGPYRDPLLSLQSIL